MTDMKAPDIPTQPAPEQSTNPPADPSVAATTPQPEPAPQSAELATQSAEPAPQSAEQAPAVQPTEAGTDSLQNQVQKIQEKTNQLHQKFNTLPDSKKKIIIYAGMFLLGLVLGGIFFGGSDNQEAPVVKGLQGVVGNSDIKTPLKRCGMVSLNDACVFYVMNNFSHEKQAKDFFPSVSDLTQRPLSLITSENIHYQTQRIKPGYFAEIKIPTKR